jgi:hypothetical protein
MRFIYQLLRIINDFNAIFKGKVGQRVKRRAVGKIVGKGILRRIK